MFGDWYVYFHRSGWKMTYLRLWEESASARPGFKPSQKRAMTLSRETIEEIRITGKLLVS